MLLCLSIVHCFSQNVTLKNGDLIFQEACPSEIENAIKQVTSSIDDYQFTHVGMVYIDSNDHVFVLEANIPEVVLTPLNDFLYPLNKKECSPKSVVGRLKKEYQYLIPKSLEIGITLIGKEYDYGYVLQNDSYYCSELIYEILKQANNGQEVFPLNIMTFKSSDSDQTTTEWIEYFQRHGFPIPEGELGINPGAMSQSDVIEILH